MAQRLSAQELAWEWVDGVRIATMEDIPPEERNDLEAYGVAVSNRLRSTSAG